MKFLVLFVLCLEQVVILTTSLGLDSSRLQNILQYRYVVYPTSVSVQTRPPSKGKHHKFYRCPRNQSFKFVRFMISWCYFRSFRSSERTIYDTHISDSYKRLLFGNKIGHRTISGVEIGVLQLLGVFWIGILGLVSHFLENNENQQNANQQRKSTETPLLITLAK